MSQAFAGIIISLVIVTGLTACAINEAISREKETAMPARTIEEVLRKHTEGLMSLPGVVGTAQGLCQGRPCIKVYVVETDPELAGKIPDSIEGYPVSVEVTGELHPLPHKEE